MPSSGDEFTLSQRQPYIKSHATKVIACSSAGCELPATAFGDALARVTALGERWLVSLSESALYPVGGGQPSDSGEIGSVRCEFVEPGQGPAGAAVHWCSGPLEIGTEVEVRVDWNRRWHNMQHHSAQHVLSAVAMMDLGAPTVSWELSRERCDVDVKLKEVPSSDVVASLEASVNAHIQAARAIRTRCVAGDDSDGELSKISADPRVRGEAPAPGTFATVRFVEIEGLDLNACGGTHVASTAELQALKVVSAQREKGAVVRFSFVCGQRLLDRLSALLTVEAQLCRKLSCGGGELVGAWDRQTLQSRALSKRKEALEGELALHLGRGLPRTEGALVPYHWPDADLPSLKKMASAYESLEPSKGEGGGEGGAAGRGGVLWLTCAPEGQSKGEGFFLLCGSEGEVAALLAATGERLKDLLRAKGGGVKGRWQGSAAAIERHEEAAELLSDALRAQKAAA